MQFTVHFNGGSGYRDILKWGNNIGMRAGGTGVLGLPI